MADTISAFRGTEKREFDTETWNLLPQDKYGWKQQSEEPEEVTQLKKSKVKDTTEEALPVSNENVDQSEPVKKEHKTRNSHQQK